MKTIYTFFVAAFLLIASASFAQSQKSVFERASMATSRDGSPCVELAWKKGSENTAYYLVERSADGAEFKPVGLVFTSEDEQFTDYKFRDKSFAAAGTAAYYRISIVSNEKELTSLPVKKVGLTAAQCATESITGAAQLASDKK